VEYRDPRETPKCRVFLSDEAFYSDCVVEESG
jgi:hypothetical protein